MPHELTTHRFCQLTRSITGALARIPYSVWLLLPVVGLQISPWLGQFAQYDRAAIGAEGRLDLALARFGEWHNAG